MDKLGKSDFNIRFERHCVYISIILDLLTHTTRSRVNKESDMKLLIYLQLRGPLMTVFNQKRINYEDNSIQLSLYYQDRKNRDQKTDYPGLGVHITSVTVKENKRQAIQTRPA